MQALYSRESNSDVSLAELEKALNSSIDRSVALYLTNIAYMTEVCQYAVVDAAKRMAKYIKTEEDHNISTQIAATRIVIFLQNSVAYQSLFKKHHIATYIDNEVVRSLFHALRDKYSYKEYTAKPNPSLEDEKEVLALIVKKIVFKSKELTAHLEEHFVNYDDDQLLLNHVLQKYIQDYKEDDENAFVNGVSMWEAERKFGSDLLRQCYVHDEELSQDIVPNLKNWDKERIATLDMLLMKMAVCELKYFPTVPVKVSINEYIDISKIYSTPKSKDFVNGVLDETKAQLQAKGLIVKQGRGLVES